MLTLTVKPSTEYTNRVNVEMTGLQPGESVVLQFAAQVGAQRQEAELRPAKGVEADGSFADSIGLVFPIEGNAPMSVTWQAKVIHSRGVACTSVRLPAQPSP